MSRLPVSLMLRFTEIIIMLRIESPLDLLKGVNDSILLLLIYRKMKSLVAVPVDILFRTFLVDVFTVFQIKPSVVMPGIIGSMSARPPAIRKSGRALEDAVTYCFAECLCCLCCISGRMFDIPQHPCRIVLLPRPQDCIDDPQDLAGYHD